MKYPRIKRKTLAYYHCITRIVGREMKLDDVGKKHMLGLIRRIEQFTGVKVLTYAIMTNHLHLLLEEPDRGTDISDEDLLNRLHALYPDHEVDEIEHRWREWTSVGNIEAVQADKQRYKKRMHDISEFMKQIKQRFSRWYNKKHHRKGALWESRFTSVLVESGHYLRIVSAYIEMNPVRAGMVHEPGKYAFCGLGEATSGSISAQRGIAHLVHMQKDDLSSSAWKHIAETYSQQVIQPNLERLYSKCRYFNDGRVLGSSVFVEQFFHENPSHFGPKRQSAARRVKGGWTELFAIRNLLDWT